MRSARMTDRLVPTFWVFVNDTAFVNREIVGLRDRGVEGHLECLDTGSARDRVRLNGVAGFSNDRQHIEGLRPPLLPPP